MKNQEKVLLTIVIPVYNEEENLDRIETDVSEYMQSSKYRSKVLFVNDGSTDKSQQKIEQICTRKQNFEFIQLAKNCGLSAAIKAGIDQLNTPLFAYIDADLQTSPQDFELLLPYANDYALVTGIRSNRKDSVVKNLSSKIANAIRRSITHDGVSDTGCPLKVMQTKYAKQIPFFKGTHRFFAAMILLQEGKVKQVPVRHFPRIAGEAKYNLWNRLLGPFADLLAFMWIKRRYINYRII